MAASKLKRTGPRPAVDKVATDFGNRLREAIRHARQTESAFERLLHGHRLCSKGDVSKWVYGDRPIPAVPILIAMADMLGVDFAWLATGRSAMLPNRTPAPPNPPTLLHPVAPQHDSEPPSVKSDVVHRRDLPQKESKR